MALSQRLPKSFWHRRRLGYFPYLCLFRNYRVNLRQSNNLFSRHLETKFGWRVCLMSLISGDAKIWRWKYDEILCYGLIFSYIWLIMFIFMTGIDWLVVREDTFLEGILYKMYFNRQTWALIVHLINALKKIVFILWKANANNLIAQFNPLKVPEISSVEQITTEEEKKSNEVFESVIKNNPSLKE